MSWYELAAFGAAVVLFNWAAWREGVRLGRIRAANDLLAAGIADTREGTASFWLRAAEIAHLGRLPTRLKP